MRTMFLAAAAAMLAQALPARAQQAQVATGENGSGYLWNPSTNGSNRVDDRLHNAVRAGQSVALTGTNYRVSSSPRYVVRSGDTLWDICASQLRNAWLWPEVWSLNPEITNPHWIYPGQVIRMRTGDDGGWSAYGQGGFGRGGGTVFFRSEGFVEAKEERDEDGPPGTIVASWEDEMLLSFPDLLYVRFRDNFPVEADQQYTIYRFREPVFDMVDEEEGDPPELGRIVEILGTVRILSFDPDARLARVKVIESINPIERGDFIGPIERNYIISDPQPAEVDLDGRIVALLRPRVLNGESFVAFINRGADAGVLEGNRFQIIRASDHYLQSLGEDVPPDLPFEWIGECQVLEARKNASTCLILTSTREMDIGERVTLIRGQ